MARKLALVLAACLGLWHATAHGLGLGEISVDSALNQPFAATIELRNSENLQRNEIIANLASSEDFDRIGVERFFFLSDLAFDTDLTDPDRPVIRITSNQPVSEPFVNFVVEVLWPSGRLLKEFTILLDPPTYASRPLTSPRAPTASTGRESNRSTPAATSTATAGGEGEGIGTLVGDTYGVTDRNDTLWVIALKVRPEEGPSVHQTMLALLRLNPEAFIGGNINQLKAGHVLRVPTLEEIQRLSYQDAVVQVAEQNDRWRAGLDRAPLDARRAVAEGRVGNNDGGELRLVSAAPTAAAAAAGSGSRAAGGAGQASAGDSAAAAQLAATQNQLGTAQQQNATLQSQLQGRAAEAQELQRQIQIRDEQIARLQQAVAQQMEAAGTAPAPTPGTAPQATSSAAAGGLFGLSWLVIGAIVGGLLLIGVIVLLVLRRLSSSGEEVTIFDDVEMEQDVEKTQLMPALTAADLGEASPSEDEADVGEDVLAEADVYMAYGNFSEAAAALSTALETDPNRADIRLKLLEVYVEQGDVDAFNEQAFALQGFADEATIAEADRLAEIMPGAAMSSGQITSGDAFAPSRDGGDGKVSLDFDLALDGDDEAAPAADAPADLDSLDIDLDMGDEAAPAQADASIDFDLDLEDDESEGALDLDDDDLALDVAGDEPEVDDFALSLEDGDGDSDEGGALPDIDFELDDAPPPAATGGDDVSDLDLDVMGDAPAEGVSSGVTSETAEDFEDRTVILGGDDLEMELEAEASDDDGSLEFDIDDLAEPGASAADDLDLQLAAAAQEPDEDITELLEPEGQGIDADLDFEIDEDFDFGDEGDDDEISTKLELARAYVDMGDEDGAKEILDEVVRDGDDGQKKEAGELLAHIG